MAAVYIITRLTLGYSRRDGSPFMNLLMVAPLYDNRGVIRYFIGCTMDVSNLIDGGRGLDSFQKLLSQERSESRFGDAPIKASLKSLMDLSQMLDGEESEVIKQHVSELEVDRETLIKPMTARRYLGMEDAITKEMWGTADYGQPGRIPGVYQNYLLVRPAPSLRITFTSPALRIPGLLQSPFLERIGGPKSVRQGIQDALTQGAGVTAKISWLTYVGQPTDKNSLDGKPRWIHCTPLLG